MAASKVQANFSAVGFTPTGGSLAPFNKITGVQYGSGGSLEAFSADSDVYPTTLALFMSNPEVTLKGGDIAAMQAVAPGTEGVLTYTHNDAKLATGGAIVYTMANAVVEAFDGGGEHAAYGEGSLKFKARSSDGVTNPISFTRT